MIKRIVIMTFRKGEIANFIEIFESSREQIRNFKGCKNLELLQDVSNPSVFMTHSYWESETALEHYRNSELFNSTWKKTKVLFAEKPRAWSLNKVV